MQPRTEDVRVASFADLDTTTLYRLLELRCAVFIVEQEAAYLDIDGRDLEPGTRHVWVARSGLPVAYLRVLAEPDGVQRIGRVVVAKEGRGSGLAGRLMDAALEIVGARPSVLDAQAHLAGFYGRYGYTISGEGYLEDGIPHVPMARAA
ncbi:GNAT family N-acetyltransferase [Asanoa sp. WMMD1127]|uniref:GNAT family N-acetyltransferase n=1 Tax=Asanoa sp. WMMD1127 TaxID=3016107 RepID=UPI002417176F|nr:GNAT family N-acetyltransferase [Asanoa sp. WMMD1127]MDG4823813.1 GNAT family N-acetyltransferase [Asanoa sp. WMMD1127]